MKRKILVAFFYACSLGVGVFLILFVAASILVTNTRNQITKDAREIELVVEKEILRRYLWVADRQGLNEFDIEKLWHKFEYMKDLRAPAWQFRQESGDLRIAILRAIDQKNGGQGIEAAWQYLKESDIEVVRLEGLKEMVRQVQRIQETIDEMDWAALEKEATFLAQFREQHSDLFPAEKE